MNSTAFLQILPSVTQVYRKGESITKHEVGNLQVTEIYAYPHQETKDESHTSFDLHFVTISVDPIQAQACKEQFIAWLHSYPQQERLAGGPSYIEFAAVAEIDQESAFRIFALGAALDLWHIITPEFMGFDGAEADAMAGNGFIMITGYNK